ncbi:MAG: hypothetical protein KDK65_05685 [Chlamydiia bacterium]|nr:hypothetical protein [Chlamydiia bacterium]
MQTLALTDLSAQNPHFLEAMRQGGFYVAIPEDCKPFLAEAVQFGNTLATNDKIKGAFRGYTGYHNPPNTQAERFFVEREYWGTLLPQNMKGLAEKMDALASQILLSALGASGIPHEHWKEVTGGLLENTGWHHLSFNHYLPGKVADLGMPAHQDNGMLTVLFVEKVGLEVKRGDQWVDVPPKEGHFVVNFSYAFEQLVNDPTKLTAVWHRVKKLDVERVSFGLFHDNGPDSQVLKHEGGKLHVVHPNFKEFVDQKFATAYATQAK